MTKIIELIYTREKIGKGTTEDPVRLKYQLFTKDGELVVDRDPENMEGYSVGMEKLQSI